METGIIRRTDDLGRVVIPKDIRAQLGIECGAPLKFFVNGGMVCMRPYCNREQEVEEMKVELRAALDKINLTPFEAAEVKMRIDNIVNFLLR